jgi:hypothetical protein
MWLKPQFGVLHKFCVEVGGGKGGGKNPPLNVNFLSLSVVRKERGRIKGYVDNSTCPKTNVTCPHPFRSKFSIGQKVELFVKAEKR